MSGWKVLNESTTDGRFPLLLIKYESQGLSYNIHVSDLTTVWSESMDRKAIARRALNDDVSIDILGGEDQCRKLLDYVGKAIDGSEGTSMHVSQEASTEPMIIKLTADLPHPLEPLVWIMGLSRAPPSVLKSEVILPSIRMLAQERVAVSSLLSIIRDKDTLINKLYDKLDLAGVDLNSLFPGMLPRQSKSLSRDTLQQHVPGLKEFDATQWQQSVRTSGQPSEGDICRFVFSPEDGNSLSIGQINGLDNPNNSSVTRTNVVFDSQPPRKTDDRSAQNSMEFETADFSKRISPPKQRRKSSRQPSLSETESEDAGEQAKYSPKPINDSKLDDHEKPSPSKKRLGTLGGRKKSASPIPASHDDGTEFKVRNENVDPSAASNVASSPSKPRGKLGRLGGKKEAPTSNDVQQIPSSVNSELPSRDKVEALDGERQGRHTTPQQQPDMPRETSQERADRKRAEIKREMEGKKNAPPKKKRKF